MTISTSWSDMDLDDPAPLAMTAEDISPILSHLSLPQYNKSPNQTNLPLNILLMKSTLNLLAQVQLEDERMDRKERLEGSERETKRSRYFAWVGLFRTTASRDLDEEIYVVILTYLFTTIPDISFLVFETPLTAPPSLPIHASPHTYLPTNRHQSAPNSTPAVSSCA